MTPDPPRGTAAPRSRRSRALLPLVTFAAVVLGGLVLQRHYVFAPEPHVDERAYLGAFELVDAGGNPYDEPWFVYTPAFAHLGAALHGALGQDRLLLAFRVAALVGLWLLLMVSLRGSRWPWPVHAAAGLALHASPLVENGIRCGNASMVLVGPLFVGMALVDRWPAVGGALLGALNALKPTAVSALVVLAVPARGWLPSRRAVRMLAAAAATALLLLLVGLRDLPSMLRRAGGLPHVLINAAPARVFYALGTPLPPALLFALFTALGAAFAWRQARTPGERLAVAGTTSLLGLPVANPNTFLLTLPAQAMALERALSGFAAARRTGADIRRPLAELALVSAAVLSVHGTRGTAATAELPLVAQGLVTAIPLLAATALTVYAVGIPASRGSTLGAPTPPPAAGPEGSRLVDPAPRLTGTAAG